MPPTADWTTAAHRPHTSATSRRMILSSQRSRSHRWSRSFRLRAGLSPALRIRGPHIGFSRRIARSMTPRLLAWLGSGPSSSCINGLIKRGVIMLTITIETARRFILGKQGLWPGRRWRGIEGTEQAMRAMEYLQLDPLNIIARSQDITLHSRILDYTPGRWEDLTYQQRKFFDWGGWLAVRPMDELPHWRVVMRRERDGDYGDSRICRLAREHADAIDEMRAILRKRSTVSNRDFEMATRTRTQHYRGRKDSALALYYLWYTGEVMTHHRENFERVYALTETVAPAHLLCESDEAEAERFFIKKDVSFSGLSRPNRVAESFRGYGESARATKELLGAMVADGDLIEVLVEGWKAVHYALGSDAAALHEVSAGRVPT